MSCATNVTADYTAYVNRKITLFFILAGLLGAMAVYSIAAGSYSIPAWSVVQTLLGQGGGPEDVVIWNIRAPRITAAIVGGWGLAISGTAIQCLLKNPLASPFTLGVSHGAVFGAAFAIVVLNAGMSPKAPTNTGAAAALNLTNIYSVTIFAFLGAMMATGVILLLSTVKKLSSEAIILAGVALSSLFVSGTILLQYFGSDVEVASIVFWTFGDVGRLNWREIVITLGAAILVTIYFVFNSWNLNALSAGDDVAGSLGVNVSTFRVVGMIMATLVTALITAFMGVIAFLGLLAPHIARRLVGPDHRYLTPHSCIIGSLLLLVSDTIGRTLIGSGTLPVGVLTSFMGAPLFLYLLVRGYSK
ncbi:MAG: iron ABC transporter permease [Syntrophaceae bacterium]|nr:iron ABC transporter permease [Syntrophaceae bacterium]